jgi:diguanylate cyclase (GGDEF)-like protein
VPPAPPQDELPIPPSPWAILEHVGAAVCVHGPAGDLVYANPMARALLTSLAAHTESGRTAHRPDGSLIRQADLPLEVTRRTGRPCHEVELAMTAPGGDIRWLRVSTRAQDPNRVPCTVVATVTDVTVQQESEAHRARALEHLADHDALTGLLNRRGFARALDEQAARARRYGTGGALLVLDLDHFKYVNDTLGHQAGDDLIVAVAQLLRERLRATDVVARLGGDEFAILLPEGGLDGAEGAAESILHALSDRPPIPGAASIRLSASIGITALDQGATAEELLVCADLAMYDAKDDGRRGWARYAAEGRDQPRTKARMTWIDRIRAALDDDGFRLLAQPIIDARSGTVAMHELLVRMQAGRNELITPAAFLFIAERYDLVQEIDRWVLGQAGALMGAARARGRRLPLSVNVSGRSLGDAAVLDALAAALEHSGADPHDLVIEITETSAVTHIDHACAFAARVKELGVRLAIDDFGAGFGAFAYLKNLPFDLLKIDGEFVQAAPTSRADALIVETVRDLAHGMGGRVVAEACSDASVHAWLLDHDIDLLQGYHLGRPRPIEELLAELTPTARARRGHRAAA